jgi:beta-galactosidase
MPDLLNPEEHCREDTFGFADCIQLDAWLMDRALFWGLDAAKIAFNSGSTEQPLEALQKYPLVLLPTFGFLGRAAQLKLLAYVRAGGTLVLGPRLPELDEQMQPCPLLKDALDPGVAVQDGIPAQKHLVGQGRVIWIQSLLPRATRQLRPAETTALLRRIAELARLGWDYTAADPDLDTVLHEDPQTRVLFVANPTPEPKLGLLKLRGAEKLTDAQTGEQWQGQGEVEIPMPAYTVRILEVTH